MAWLDCEVDLPQGLFGPLRLWDPGALHKRSDGNHFPSRLLLVAKSAAACWQFKGAGERELALIHNHAYDWIAGTRKGLRSSRRNNRFASPAKPPRKRSWPGSKVNQGPRVAGVELR